MCGRRPGQARRELGRKQPSFSFAATMAGKRLRRPGQVGATDAWPEGEPNRVSSILNMACRADLLWNFEKFMQETAATEPLKMFVGTLELILWSPVLKQRLEEIFLVSRQEFKDRSQQGFVWRRACPQDLGNCRYALLYQLLVAMATAKKDKKQRDPLVF